METIMDRERAEEARFAYAQQSEFTAHARQFREVGIWAAGLLKKENPTAYAESVSALVIRHPFAVAKEMAAETLAADLAGLAEREEIISRLG